MAALGAQTIASSYEQLLHTDTDGGGNGNTLVTIKDGDNGTTFGIKLATNKVEIIPGSNDANAFEVSQADGTAVLTVNTSTVGATLIGALTVGVDDAGHDVIFYGNTASSNMTWDTSADDLILNDSTLLIDQDDNTIALKIDSEATSTDVFEIDGSALTSGRALLVYSASDRDSGAPLVRFFDDNASNDGNVLEVRQDGDSNGIFIDHNGNGDAISIDFEGTSGNCIEIQAPTSTTGTCLLVQNANALTTGGIAEFHSNSSDTGTRDIVKIQNDHASATGTTGLRLVQDAAAVALSIDQNADSTSILIDSESTSANVLNMASATTTTGNIINLNACDALTTGKAIYVDSNSSDNSTRNLVEIVNNHTSADNTVGLLIQQDGADASIELTGNGSIKFPGTQGASADANSLDDYEEGTWTPAILYQNASGVTLDYATDGFQVGRYTKIGNVVHARFSIQVDISGSPVNDNISISGFPFTSVNIANFEGAGIADQLMITGKANYALSMGGNSTQAGMILSSISGNQGDEIGTGDNYRFNGGITYLAA